MHGELDSTKDQSFASLDGLSGEDDQRHRNYCRIAQAIRYLNEHHRSQPSLAELAAEIGVSEFHFQRIFTEWAGVSPKQFLQFLTKEFAKQQLKAGSVLDASLNSGLSGSSRLHDLLLKWENVTPGDIRQAGLGMEIRYGVHATPFGYCLAAVCERGVCKLAFLDGEAQLAPLLEELRKDWAKAHIVEDSLASRELCRQIFTQAEPIENEKKSTTLHMLLQGSPFKLQVWEALLRVPERSMCSYQQIATAINRPTATRAVATAIASNRIAYLIPCHRVIRSTGVLSQYRWGVERKAAMLGFEQRKA